MNKHNSLQKEIDTLINDKYDKILMESFPIKIEVLAKSRGLNIMPYAFEDDISGVLVIDGENATIGYNMTQSRVRRRFTIAHELGHYELHRSKSTLFMDKDYKAFYRSTFSSDTEESQKIEQEANTFAASILMPEQLLKQQIGTGLDLSSEDDIKRLAKLFDVSSTAMYYRLLNLVKNNYLVL
jgi:Zn-dependent peptidase ImmA (M78 family)